MKKFLSTRIGQIIYSLFIFVTAFLLLNNSPLNMVHGRSDTPVIVAIFGAVFLLVSYVLDYRFLTFTTSVGYVVACILGIVFQSNGLDPAGGATNNLWKIWLISYWIFILIGIIISFIHKKIKVKLASRRKIKEEIAEETE